jgi:hypothetical protein
MSLTFQTGIYLHAGRWLKEASQRLVVADLGLIARTGRISKPIIGRFSVKNLCPSCRSLRGILRRQSCCRAGLGLGSDHVEFDGFLEHELSAQADGFGEGTLPGSRAEEVFFKGLAGESASHGCPSLSV